MKTSKNAHAAHAGLRANIAKAARTAVTAALICALLAGMLTACGGDSSKTYDLQEVYQEILAAQPEDAALLWHITQVIQTVAKEQGLAENGFRIAVNTGRDGAQTVPHLHFHILGGRAMGWPPG